jgi:hypothetical protein
MCGIVGVMKRDLGIPEINRFRDLFAVAQVRGDDGSGIFAVPRAGPAKPVAVNGKQGVKFARTTWSSGHLVTTKEFYDAIKGELSILVGHARQPTRGGSTIDMVHPHRSEHIILVHNGTMTFVNGISLKQGESDSKAICKALATVGPQKFVQDSYGAYALIWVDLKQQTLNFLRNGERPLWMVEEKDSMVNGRITTLWWASESWMVPVCLSRYPAYNKEKHRLFQLPKDELWSYPLDVDFFLKEPKIEKCEKKYTSYTYGGSYGMYGDDWENDIPFAGGTTNTGGKSSVIQLSPPNNTDKDKFSYIPPEHRQTGPTSSTESTSRPTLTSGTILKNSKLNAEMATVAAEKGGKAQTDMFRKDDLTFYQAKDYKEACDLINAGPCVWCDTSPAFVSDVTPKVYPVRFSANKRDYICHACMADEDAQRMLGIAS